VRLEESGEEPARAMHMALRQADIPIEEVQYVNYHGTSTELNDRIETKAMKIAFGERASRIPGSALKSLIGHPQGACGAAGLAATLLGMRDGVVHGTRNLEEADPECDLDYITEGTRKLQIDNAVCNCIAFGSKNSALVIKRA
jgi:3-oxoacyl-[acyl-carrier-protein] synthase II